MEKKESVRQRLKKIQETYGYHFEKLLSRQVRPDEVHLISDFMNDLKKNEKDFYTEILNLLNMNHGDIRPYKKEASENNKKIKNYRGIKLDFKNSDRLVSEIEESDILILSGPGWRLTVRPSGTEPKIKFYLMAFSAGNEKDSKGRWLKGACEKRFKAVAAFLDKYLDDYFGI